MDENHTEGNKNEVTCVISALFAFRIAEVIDLTQIEKLKLVKEPEVPEFKYQRRTPPYLTLPPLIVLPIPGCNVRLGDKVTVEQTVDLTIFMIGAISVRYEIKFTGKLEELAVISRDLQASTALLDDARARVKSIAGKLAPAVKEPRIFDDYEDFFVFDISADEKADGAEFVAQNAGAIAGLLRGESAGLAEIEIEETLAAQTGYFKQDRVVIAWNGALLYGSASADEALVLEFANVQLLLIRLLNSQLEQAVKEVRVLLESAVEGKTKNMRDLRNYLKRAMNLQLDAAFAVDAVTNEFELIGDQYLARVYRLAVETFAMSAWETQIREKSALVESAYDKLSTHMQHEQGHRYELVIIALEMIVIFLIVLEVILAFFDHGKP